MKRPLAITLASFALVLGAAACVDLFHSTNFETLCQLDAAACGADRSGEDQPDGNKAETGGPDASDFCANSPEMAQAKAKQTCAWIGHCLGSRENSSYADCYVRALAAYDCAFNPSLRPRGSLIDFWACLSTVDSCDSVNQCIFGTKAVTKCPATGVSGTFTACSTESSEPMAVVGCSASQTPTGMEACALRGQKCTKVDSNTALCTGTLRDNCDPTTTPPKCDGTFAVRCSNIGGVEADKGTDCALVGGGQCFADDAGAGCTGVETETCNESSTIKCNKAIAESCLANQLVRVNCGSLDQACSASDAVAGDPITACKIVVNPCTETEDRCVGSALKSCRNGTTFSVDCQTITGMTTCAKAPDQWAACAP